MEMYNILTVITRVNADWMLLLEGVVNRHCFWTMGWPFQRGMKTHLFSQIVVNLWHSLAWRNVEGKAYETIEQRNLQTFEHKGVKLQEICRKVLLRPSPCFLMILQVAIYPHHVKHVLPTFPSISPRFTYILGHFTEQQIFVMYSKPKHSREIHAGRTWCMDRIVWEGYGPSLGRWD